MLGLCYCGKIEQEKMSSALKSSLSSFQRTIQIAKLESFYSMQTRACLGSGSSTFEEEIGGVQSARGS